MAEFFGDLELPNNIFEKKITDKQNEIKYKNDEGKWNVAIKEFAKTEAGNRELYFPDSLKWTLAQIQHLNPHGEYLFMNNGKCIRENTNLQDWQISV